MNELKQYRCVNCGEPAAALFKTYGPTVLKLTKCDKCKGIVDKYIEYDPVIVMIDLVLMSREAQRHVLYNTEFKSYWKLLVILVMLETYGVWRSDSLFNIVVNHVCGHKYTANDSQLVVPLQGRACAGWIPQAADGGDVFIWEKDFYIKFIAIFTGIAVFIATTHGLMRALTHTRREVPLILSIKSFCLSDVSVVLSVVSLVWGAGDVASRLAHYCLVFAYSTVVFSNVFTVLYECSPALGGAVLCAGVVAKHATTFYVTAGLKTYIT